MGRLYRGLYRVEVTRSEPGFDVTYEDAERLLHQVTQEGAIRARIVRVPGTRAPWEYKAPYEASDPPQWGKD
jgi:hypothetical protein